MIGRHGGFIAHCKGDTEFPKFLHYHCIIHQQSLCAKVIGFDHVMTPIVKIINGIRPKAKQHRTFKVLLEEMSADYGDLVLHTEIRWLSRGRILLQFMQSRGEDTSLLEDTDWILDLAFLTDITEKLNSLNCELQGKRKMVADMISALNAFKAKMSIFSVHLKRKKVQHFRSEQMVLKDNTFASKAFAKAAKKYSRVRERLGQEFENRFCDLAYQGAPNFWGLVDTEKYSGVCTAALKVVSLFGSTYLCESAFFDMNFIKNKHRTLQHTGGEHAMSGFPLSDKQTDTRFGVQFKICHS
ncbi:hypothetical protein Q5P01_011913 [Channa striata]|uniref:Uncharacterized protein n=1 Tax=Channa striata TaxID=64152 RepID=A0AA88MRE7_CHASR|nr:hypothetical protein Q5P01_011913 [Channa striata]